MEASANIDFVCCNWIKDVCVIQDAQAWLSLLVVEKNVGLPQAFVGKADDGDVTELGPIPHQAVVDPLLKTNQT